jgi:hypothetical protein
MERLAVRDRKASPAPPESPVSENRSPGHWRPGAPWITVLLLLVGLVVYTGQGAFAW